MKGKNLTRHIVAEKDEPTSNLLVAMANKLGSHIESIGISTGCLSI